MNPDRFPNSLFFRVANSRRLLALLPALALAGMLLISTWVALAASANQSGQVYENLADSVPPEDFLSISRDAGTEQFSADRFVFTQVISEVTKLTTGGSVSISSDTIVVGVPGEDGGPGDPLPNAGAVYVFARNQGGIHNWGEVARLTASDAEAHDRFGWSVSISGDIVVVGADWEGGVPGDPLFRAGAAYVFGRNQGGANNWGEVTKLTASDAQAYDQFGYSISIGGDTIVVGASDEDGGPGDPLATTGAAYVFGRDQGRANNWGEVAKLTASDAEASDRFGWSVSISGETIVVGAILGDSGTVNDAGAAYVFARDQGGANNWGQVAKLTASDAQEVDEFGGWSVSISGDTIVVGAAAEDGGTGDPLGNAGAAYVFRRDQGGANNWGEVAKLTASDAHAFDLFGLSVSNSGETIVVGAWREDGGPGDPLEDAGAAYVFRRNQGGPDNWGEVTKLAASDAKAYDEFGHAVSISGDTIVVVGAQNEAAYVFGPPPPVLDPSVYLPLVIRD